MTCQVFKQFTLEFFFRFRARLESSTTKAATTPRKSSLSPPPTESSQAPPKPSTCLKMCYTYGSTVSLFLKVTSCLCSRRIETGRADFCHVTTCCNCVELSGGWGSSVWRRPRGLQRIFHLHIFTPEVYIDRQCFLFLFAAGTGKHDAVQRNEQRRWWSQVS